MKRSWGIISAIAVSSLVLAGNAHADLITAFHFADGNWTASTDQSAGVGNSSSFSASTITADKSSGTGGARITLTLTGSISTLGFESIELGFDGSATGGLEWNGDLSGAVGSSDGLLISGSGLNVDTNGINNTSAETDFDMGSTFPTSNFSAGFAFSSSVADSAITDLEIVLQVNANDEVLSASNFQLLGSPIAVPEPTSLVLLGAGLLCPVGYRRLRRGRR